MTPRPTRPCVLVAAGLAAGLLLTGCSAQGPVTPSASGTPGVASVAPSPSPTPPVTPSPSSPPASTPSGGASATSPAATLSCPNSTGASLRRAPGGGKTVALTFDDGPGPQTLAVADVLDAAGVHATFFQTGQHATASPDITRELARRGHLVAGHSWDHRYPKSVPGGWTTAFVADQVTRTASLLRQTTGQPACFFRPPGGYLDNVPSAARKTGVTVVMWSIDSLDWQQPGTTTKEATATIVANATKVGDQTHPIVLFHDAKASAEADGKVSPNRSNTIAALPEVIAWYKARGYSFVLLDGRT